jgi:multicomponent Na+:H+ antiporter subunit D
VVKAGVFTILKVVIFIFGFDLVNSAWSQELLLYAAATTIIIGSLIALRQDNLKRRLAYSTISQLSYIVLGALLVNSASLTGSAMHMVTHAFGKITLFFCAGAILVTTHKTKVSELSGLGRQMPITMAAFFIASISIIGLPPAAGTWSKWYLAMGTVESGQWLLLGILMVSSLLNIAYLLPIPLNAFLGSSGNNKSHFRKHQPLYYWP